MQDSPSERQQIAEMMSDRYREEWDERFERNLEASRISREVARVLQDIDNSCLKPLLCFLRSVPSGFSPLPVSSLEKLLEQSEEEYNSLSEVDSEEAELSSSDGGSWADIVMGSGAGLTGLRQSANLHRRLLGGYLSSPIRYGYGLSCGQFGADRGRGVQYGGSERQEAPAVESTEEVQSSTKTFKVAISVQQVQHIYRIGGISNENVWTALFGDYTKDEEGRYVVARYKMPSFLSNKILMESYSSVVQVSELQNNSMQVYMFCRSVLKHFCMDILTPRILIHANIFLLWNGTLKDVFSNKTYERLLSDILSTTTDSSDQADSSSSCEGNNLGVSDGVFSLYSGLVDGTLPSLLLLRVLEEEFAKFSVLAHFMIRIFGYLDRNSCHVFSNSPDLNITALLYFYKCVFFPLSSSFTAALLNIVTVERDFFIQASLRCLFSSRVDDGKVFDCVDKLASGGEDAAEMEAEVEAEVEEALLGARRDHERRSPQKCSKESHFLNEMYFNGNSLLLQRFSDKIHNKILFNVINNIVLTMSSSSSNKISLKRTNTSSVAEGSSEGSGGTSSSYLEPDAFGRGGQWPRVERRMTGLDRASRTIDPSLDLGGGEGQSGQGTSRSSGLFWFSDEEIDQTVYKTTIEDPFLRGTLYYYYNRLDGFFGFLDLKQSCMLVNWILLEEERRVRLVLLPVEEAGGVLQTKHLRLCVSQQEGDGGEWSLRHKTTGTELPLQGEHQVLHQQRQLLCSEVDLLSVPQGYPPTELAEHAEQDLDEVRDLQLPQEAGVPNWGPPHGYLKAGKLGPVENSTQGLLRRTDTVPPGLGQSEQPQSGSVHALRLDELLHRQQAAGTAWRDRPEISQSSDSFRGLYSSGLTGFWSAGTLIIRLLFGDLQHPNDERDDLRVSPEAAPKL
ncbi:hypothetical protein OJ252_1289 [Cryptosporidium canis]|uniref:Uncharacterized protein n=1 Tax=Cryptosporidium canis TaxID=195482 RepID=A0ABQ8P8H5_9CRYT|nr:hypothetical protein OJ252_1289 [Cryptosporidium canis]